MGEVLTSLVACAVLDTNLCLVNVVSRLCVDVDWTKLVLMHVECRSAAMREYGQMAWFILAYYVTGVQNALQMP